MADRPSDKEALEVAALFERERRRGDPSEEIKAEVRARLDASISARPAVPGELTVGAPATPGQDGPSGGWAGLRPPLMAAGLGFVLVGGLGLIWMARHPTAIETLPSVATPAPEVAVPPPAVAAPAPAPTPESLRPAPPESPSRALRRPVVRPESRAIAPPPSAPAPAVRDADLELGIERDLLQRARADFRAGRLTEALRPLEEHARRFPRGRLEEERDALRIQTLARLGEGSRASELAREFAVRFPESPLLGAVRASIGAAP